MTFQTVESALPTAPGTLLRRWPILPGRLPTNLVIAPKCLMTIVTASPIGPARIPSQSQWRLMKLHAVPAADSTPLSAVVAADLSFPGSRPSAFAPPYAAPSPAPTAAPSGPRIAPMPAPDSASVAIPPAVDLAMLFGSTLSSSGTPSIPAIPPKRPRWLPTLASEPTSPSILPPLNRPLRPSLPPSLDRRPPPPAAAAPPPTASASCSASPAAALPRSLPPSLVPPNFPPSRVSRSLPRMRLSQLPSFSAAPPTPPPPIPPPPPPPEMATHSGSVGRSPLPPNLPNALPTADTPPLAPLSVFAPITSAASAVITGAGRFLMTKPVAALSGLKIV